jgi:hypothetical protein
MNDHSSTLTDDAVAALLVDTEPYLSCDDCFERIDQYVEQRLAEPSHRDCEMDTHLTGCGVCAEEARTLEDLLRQDADPSGGTDTEDTVMEDTGMKDTGREPG